MLARRYQNYITELFGFKVDMEGLEKGEDKLRLKLRSLFAEDESDHLLFKPNAAGKLDLMATPFAETLDVDKTVYLTTAKSVPAFLSNLTLGLFDQQTFLG